MSAEMTLPDSWIITQLGKYIYLKNGYAFKSNSYVDEKGSNTVPIIRISDIDGKYATDLKAMHVSSSAAAFGFEVEKGDLLIAMSGATTGKVGVYNGNIPAYQNQRVGNLKFINETYKSESFRNHLIAYLSPEILKIAYGGAQPNISGKAIEEMNVVIPPIAEQHKIAQRLDELLAQVDTIKARLDAIPAILKRFRQSVLSAAVSGKLTDEWKIINQIEKKSQIKSLNSICVTAFDGPFGSKLKSEDYTDSGVRVCRLENIGHLSFIENKVTFISNEKGLELEKNTLNVGDILFSSFVDEEIRVCQLPELDSKFINKADCFCFRINDDYNSKFVLYSLATHETYRKIRDLVHGATRPRVNLSFLKSFELEIPSRLEQDRIVQYIEQYFIFAEQIEQRVNDAKARVDKLTQSILAKAFRGELTADWRAKYPELISGENSAEALLAKIQAAKAALEGKKKKGKAA